MEDTELVELVIKVPYGVYKKALAIKGTDEELCFEDKLQLEVGIEGGKMLPKSHGDLKDVDQIKKEAVDMSHDFFNPCDGVWVEDIDDAETIIPADR